MTAPASPWRRPRRMKVSSLSNAGQSIASMLGGIPTHALVLQRWCIELTEGFKGVNTSIAEQTFAWFRTYVGTFNTMNPSSQRFCVRLFASRHNDLIRTCKATHLNEYSTRKRQARAAAAWRRPASRANPCKRPAGKGVIKQLKRPSAWRVKSN